MKNKAFTSLKRLPTGVQVIELDLFMFPAVIQKRKKDRPYHPYALLMVETQHGLVVGTDLLNPLPSLKEMWGEVPLRVAQILLTMGEMPQKI